MEQQTNLYVIKMKIGIFLSCYNSEDTIQECVDSILEQSCSDFNLYIFDDNSEDNTVEKIKKNKDQRIKLICSEKNKVSPFVFKSEYVPSENSVAVGNVPFHVVVLLLVAAVVFSRRKEFISANLYGQSFSISSGCASLGDMNGDGGWNVLDIVALANCVLASNCSEL